jgi:hypothetical protein
MTNNKNMRKCKDCGNYISKKAKVCPYCGRDDRPIGQKIPAVGCLGIIILIIALWGYLSTMSDILHR